MTRLPFISIPGSSNYCARWLITALIFILLAIFVCNIVGAAGTGRKLVSELCAAAPCEQMKPVRWAHFDDDAAGQNFTPGNYSAATLLTQGTPGVISFAQSAFSVDEGGAPAMFKLTRTGGTDGAVTAKISLTDGTASTADYRYHPGDLDTTFPPYTGYNSLPYNSMLVALPDGKLLVSANTGVARLNADGTTDTTFNALGVANNTVYTMAQQPDGKVVIGGGFTSINSIRRNHIARLNANGTLDTTFDVGVGADNEVDYIALQPDGKMIIVGYFSHFNSEYRSAARLNPDGSLDPSFTFTGGTFVKKIIVQPDGKILMVGSGIRRLNPDGTDDDTFVRNASPVSARDATLLPDGRMLISGSFSQIDGQTIYNVARLMPDGSLDPTFSTGTGPDSGVAAVASQADGKVIIAGYFRSYNNAPVSAPVIRLNMDGSLDTTFSAPATASSTDYITAMIVQPDGHVIISGYFNIYAGPAYRGNFARLQGDLFATWNNGDAGDKTISLPIADDLLDEPDETLNLTVTPLTGGVATGTYPTATLTIVDNDVPPVITSGLPPALVNQSGSMNHIFTATGFPAPTFSVSAGTLPPGLFLSPSGQLSGFAYTPGAYNNITVTASNGVAPVATQTFNIRVNAIPSAVFDSYSVSEDNTLTVAAPGVLGNDTDQDHDPLTAILVSSTTRGTLSFQPDGSFTYVPVVNFAGTDSFVYYVTDGNVRSNNNVSVQLNVNAVNDPPVNTVPGAQSTYDNAPLVFSTTNNNLISVADIDGGFGALRITLAATNGTVTLKSISGLSFVAGDGTADANMIFAGSLPGINNALNGMSFNPALGSTGAASLQITTNDQGNTGTGGALGDTDAVSINVLTSTVQFSAASYQFGEGDMRATFTVTRSGNLATTAAVDFMTVDDAADVGCADSVNNHGAAYARCDYATVVSTVTFAAGEASKTISVPLIDDAQVEGDETFQVRLSNQVGVGALGAPNVTVTIRDNDTVPTANPVFSSPFFVRQQYLDFLSREPEQSGYDAWLGVLNRCGDVNNTDPNSPHAGCDRITVSSSFFGSQEFQLKGYYVYRFYKLAFGRLPEYAEIIPDMSTVSGATAAEVYAKKAAFANAFIQRPAFVNNFGTRTNADYVTALMGRYGLSSIRTPEPAAPDGATKLTLSSVDLINRLTTGTLTRAQVLRAIADSDQVGALEFNKAFVAMQYYGYLRRAPEEDGYQSWLRVINRDPNNIRLMVDGFMNSVEYRLRFGRP